MKEAAVGLGRNQRPVLSAEIRACQVRNRHPVADGGIELLHIRQVNFRLAFEDFIDVIAPRTQADVPLLDVANSPRTFQCRSRHAGDIAERKRPQVEHQSLIGLR